MKKKQERQTIKFANREDEQRYCKEFFASTEPVINLLAERRIGLTFFLKKLYEDEIFQNKKSRKYDIYLVNLSERNFFEERLFENIIQQGQGRDFLIAQENLAWFIIKNILSLGIPFFYLINNPSINSGTGSFLANTSKEMLNFKISNKSILSTKLVTFFRKKRKKSIIMIDGADYLSEEDCEIIRRLFLANEKIKFVFAYSNKSKEKRMNDFVHLFFDKAWGIKEKIIWAPDEKMIKELYRLYEKDYNPQNGVVNEKNIYKIMNLIINDDNLFAFDEVELLNYISCGKSILTEDILQLCYVSNIKHLIGLGEFKTVLQKMIEQNILRKENGHITLNCEWSIPFIDKVMYNAKICEILFRQNYKRLNSDQLTFVIENEQLFARKIEAAIYLAKSLYKQGKNISEKLSILIKEALEKEQNENKKEQLEVLLAIYYLKNFNYSSAKILLEKSARRSFLLKKLYAYSLNRTQNLEDAISLLIELMSQTSDKEELAILLSILLISFLHNNQLDEALAIYNNKSDFFNYKQIQSTNNKVYFLRNIIYYLSSQEAEECLSTIKYVSSETNQNVLIFSAYNNFFARMIAVNQLPDPMFIQEMLNRSQELPYYEQRLFFNNLGLYYLETNFTEALKCFEKVEFITKSHSELPYLYSKINTAITYAYHGEMNQGRNIMDELADLVENSKLVTIKSAYYSALLLLDYMEGKSIQESSSKLLQYPFRAGKKQTELYVKKVKQYIESKQCYSKDVFKQIFKKNVTFYWYIDPLALFNSNEFLAF